MIRAVIGDTWQQSRQQVVFIVMLVVMLVVLVAGIALPRTYVTADGEKHFGLVLSDGPVEQFFSLRWTQAYAEALGIESDGMARRRILRDNSLSATEKQQQMRQLDQTQQRLRDEAVAKVSTTPVYQRALEYYVHIVINVMFTLSMLLFIAACAGYFPAMLTSGAVDIVLSKPLSRLKIYASKYVGGIVLFAGAITLFCVLLFVGIGIRTGIFPYRVFLCIPLLAFTAMLLYAILALIGTASRSATMAVVMGYVFYVVVDTLVTLLLNLKPVFDMAGWTFVAKFTSALQYVLPNFGMLKDMSLASLLNMPVFEFTPFAVALAWLAGCLGLGYWAFSRRDY